MDKDNSLLKITDDFFFFKFPVGTRTFFCSVDICINVDKVNIYKTASSISISRQVRNSTPASRIQFNNGIW